MTAVIVPGLFATVALPAYAFSPVTDTAGAEATAQQQLRTTASQRVVVADDAAATAIARDTFSATTEAELERAALERAELERAALAATYAAYQGPTAADYLASPAYPNFSLDQLVQVALQYQGVPYVYGGATPSGFDCSGFVMFVYAQFGIGLPHGVTSQSRVGTRIDPAAAVPGDVVMLSDGSHNGIWMGGGMILDAPQPGGVVSVRPLWTSNYYIMRFGI